MFTYKILNSIIYIQSKLILQTYILINLFIHKICYKYFCRLLNENICLSAIIVKFA